MDEYAASLVDAVERELPAWVERSVARIATAYFGRMDDTLRHAAADAGQRAAADVGVEMRALLTCDIDDQASTPLTILRAAVRFPTEVLRSANVPPIERDEQQERLFPDDDYDLTPANFADVGPTLADPGLRWGAAKAHTHLQRHRGTES
jgi:hypothetical protein